jgi:hypothetical protein
MRIIASLGLLLAVACDDGGSSEVTPDGGSPGDGDVGDGDGDGDGDGADAGDGDIGDGDGDVTPFDSGTPSDAAVDITLPMHVDDFYIASGYIGNYTGIVESPCPEAGPSGELKYCHQFTYDKGSMWGGGVYWQSPANNWTAPGPLVPPGAKAIQFWAWGLAGGEIVKFGAGEPDSGTEAPDFFHVETAFTLTTTPKLYTVSLEGVTYTTVASAFFWAGESGTIFIDDIEWTADPNTVPDDAGVTDSGTEPVVDGGPLPDGGSEPSDGGVIVPPEPQTLLMVDDVYARSGYLGNAAGIMESACPAVGPSGDLKYCHEYTWTKGSDWGGGVFWQYPANQWNGPGYPMPKGATEIRLWAWSTTNGQIINVGAGIGGDGTQPPDYFHTEHAITLGTTPAEYTISLSGISYDQVAGAFVWSGGGSGTIFLDGIRWVGYPVVEDDAGTGPGPDAGTTPVDAGTTPVDAGVEFDAGTSMDASVPDDAGAALVDAAVGADAGP